MPSDTPPARVKKAWRMLGAEREDASIIVAGMTSSSLPVKSWQDPELRIGDRQHFERLAHLVRRREARERRLDVRDLLRYCVLLQARGALNNAKPAQEFALRDRPMCRRAVSPRPHNELAEVHLRCEVGFAWIGERIGIAVTAHRLQRIAKPECRMAVIDDQRGTALPDNALCKKLDRSFLAQFKN